jgi:hypothetical protein
MLAMQGIHWSGLLSYFRLDWCFLNYNLLLKPNNRYSAQRLTPASGLTIHCSEKLNERGKLVKQGGRQTVVMAVNFALQLPQSPRVELLFRYWISLLTA